MRLGQRGDFPRLLNGKPPRPIAALQVLKAVNGNARGTRCELQEARFLLRIPGPYDLPEVLDHFVLLLVAAVIGVFLPIFNVDICNAANKKLQFTLVEDVDEVSWDKFVESGDESVELLLYSFLNFPFCDQSIFFGGGSLVSTS